MHDPASGKGSLCDTSRYPGSVLGVAINRWMRGLPTLAANGPLGTDDGVDLAWSGVTLDFMDVFRKVSSTLTDWLMGD
ncbi:MAG: hypothetical protein NVS4B6_27220 [Mycobacterium sp.]